MCGIGLLYSQKKTTAEREHIAKKMMESIHHRGPDGHGLWSNSKGLTMLHTRLAILELSPLGHQPMHSVSGLWTIIFNGEIYNHSELRKQYLSDHIFRGNSDTETLIQLIETYGFENALKKCRGMFAIVAIQNKHNTLYLARDRFGEKPLYWGRAGQDLIIGSELKLFHEHPEFNKKIKLEAVAEFLRLNHVPQPMSIFESVFKLPPASLMRIDLETMTIQDPKKYWNIPTSNEKHENSFDIEKRLHEKLTEAIELQMRSDVPYGSFLSGGVDSSAVTAIMQTLSKKPIETFSIGFEDPDFNEAPYAKSVAQALGTNHHEYIISIKEALSIVPKISTVYDEPFADSSQIPTFLLSQVTKSKVTVCLSGDGGDELFYGYNRYHWTQKIWATIGWIPQPIRSAISGCLELIPISILSKIYFELKTILPKNLQYLQAEDKITKLIQILKVHSPREIFYQSLQYWNSPEKVLMHPASSASLVISNEVKSELNLSAFMLWHDQTHYLSDDIMVKVDRASMAHSLETRAPFLDHELVELVADWPLHERTARPGKKYLKEILYKHIDRKLIDRPKMGFGIPLRQWLQKDLKTQVLDLLSSDRISQDGLFSKVQVEKLLKNFYIDEKPVQNLIWPIFIYQLWQDKWLKK